MTLSFTSVSNWDVIHAQNFQKTDRFAVQGGWIVRCRELRPDDYATTAMAMVFIPDPQHTWEVDS
jgi:hypothetical protein